MPRPERVRAREAARGGAVGDPAANDQTGAGDTQMVSVGGLELSPIDNGGEAVETNRTGQVSEGELDLSRQVARRLGWVPLNEWKRDPTKWSDGPQFLEHITGLAAENTTLRDRLRRSGQVAEDLAETARKEAREQAERELREAARSGDEDKAVAAAAKVAKNSGPHPQTQAWLARNEWFNADPEAQALAVTAINRAAQSGATIEAQLEAGEAAARKRFPEHFGAQTTPPTEIRLSEHRPTPPALAGGSRGGGRTQAAKEKGWMDIPSTERNQMTRFVRDATRKGLSEADATARLAASYWREKA